LEALRNVLAVYSAHPSAPLSLLARSAPFTPADFGELERMRQAVRVVGMRGSGFLAPAETAGRMFAATRWTQSQIASRLRALGLDARRYAALKPRILEAAREPITPRELQRALGTDESAVLAMRTMAREGLILRVGWDDRVRSDSLRWVATESWLGHALDESDADAARAWLAAAYLRAFGPARVEDVAWWIGISRAAARAALVGAALAEVEDGLLLPTELVEAYRSSPASAPDGVDVLPKWDPYTMAYAPDGRGRLVADAHLPYAYSTAGNRIGATSGDGLPLILVAGRAVASWEHRLDGRRMTVTLRPFAPRLLPAAGVLEEAFRPIGELFGVRIELATARKTGPAR
jgi:hypothetical protein